MNDRKHGSLVVSAALASFAGVLGSLLTLLVTSNLKVPVPDTPAAIPGVGSAAPDFNQAEAASELNLDLDWQQPSRKAYDELRAALQDASDERAQLAKTVAQLMHQVEFLESDSINQSSLAELQEATDAEVEQYDQGIINSGNFGESAILNERVANLVAAGVEYNSAQALQDRQDSYQLARLEIFDLAEREGWIDTEQFDTRLEELDSQRVDLREELGDEQYDRYLFEAGRNNRVVIESIIPGSEAEFAGLRPQDMVITYAQGRVFSTRELQQATREGVRGEIVSMQVERQGQIVFIEVTRGPLGVSLRADKQGPS